MEYTSNVDTTPTEGQGPHALYIETPTQPGTQSYRMHTVSHTHIRTYTCHTCRHTATHFRQAFRHGLTRGAGGMVGGEIESNVACLPSKCVQLLQNSHYICMTREHYRAPSHDYIHNHIN